MHGAVAFHLYFKTGRRFIPNTAFSWSPLVEIIPGRRETRNLLGRILQRAARFRDEINPGAMDSGGNDGLTGKWPSIVTTFTEQCGRGPRSG